MKNTVNATIEPTPERMYTTYEHAQIIACAALRTMSNTEGNGVTTRLRKSINGSDAWLNRMYAIIDESITLYDDDMHAIGYRTEANQLIKQCPNEVYSDANDLVNVAALAICEAVPHAIHNEPYTLPEDARKAAYHAIRNYVYSQQHKPTTKTVFVDDLKRNDAGEIIDTEYIRVTKYYDVPDLESQETYTAMLEAIHEHISEYAYTILHKRMQGISVSEIAEKMGVSQPAISKQLTKVQGVVSMLYPDAIRLFADKRGKK